jgi:uncharacterized protein
MKRIFVICLKPVHAVVAVVLLVSLVLVIALWPRPQPGGEGGWAQTFYSTSEALPVAEMTDHSAFLAIIIDDFGSGRDGVRQMMSIDRHLTFAVMPFCPFTKEDAEKADSLGYEVIVHLPMEPMHGQPSWLGPNGILVSYDSQKISALTRMALADVPHAKGVNVHMGSKASADERVMGSILKEVADAGMFFVDSKTGLKSVILSVADKTGVPCVERNVFLDGQQPKAHVLKQLKLAEEVALKQGYAVAIGHVGVEGGKVTAEAIEQILPELDQKGIKLVFVSELLQALGKQ